jgi:N-acetylglutamate synthase-like GNAT family acetyltransferase
MQIRKATADDFPAIVELIKQFPDKLMQDHLPDPEEFTVAIEDGRVIGCCCTGNIFQTPRRNPKPCRLG